MRTETLTESRAKHLHLDPSVAEALRTMGQQLASKTTWWGAESDTTTEDDDPFERTVIRCTLSGPGVYEVTVNNAVGMVAVDDLQILVRPKIPDAHFLFLLEASESFPRTLHSKGFTGQASHFWELVAEWYTDALERLLRHGVILDYVGRTDTLPAVRGRVQPQETALAYYQGQIGIACEYDEFGSDTPLNRIVRAAGERIMMSPSLPPTLRRRARASLSRLDDVGVLQQHDLRATVDRRTGHYRDALVLARHILAGIHRTLSHGEHVVWTFLVPTPLMVEAGVRNLLAHRLPAELAVAKRSFALGGTTMRMNPDLVFGNVAAVGDVKYKLSTGGAWPRGDLNQIVAFAAAARTQRGIVVGFRGPNSPPLPDLWVGDFEINYVGWRAGEDVNPSDAADELSEDIRALLASRPASLAAVS